MNNNTAHICNKLHDKATSHQEVKCDFTLKHVLMSGHRETYMRNAVVPTHSFQTCCSKDDCGVVVSSVEFVQSCVQVTSLRTLIKDNVNFSFQWYFSKTIK